MGMTILQAKRRLHEKWMELTKNGTDEEMMQALSIADTVLGSYDESLKADMVAMLTELQTEIEEIKMGDSIPFGFEPVNKFYEGVSASSRVIQQKINLLKENENGIK